MRYQKAKELTEIFPLLYSEDYEVVLVGMSMLKEHPIVKNLSKHYKCKVRVHWPGWSEDCPKKFKSCVTKNTWFSKKVVNSIFNYKETNAEVNQTLLLIIAWIDVYTRDYRNKRYKTELPSTSFHGHTIEEHSEDIHSTARAEEAQNRRNKLRKKPRQLKSVINMLNRVALDKHKRLQEFKSNWDYHYNLSYNRFNSCSNDLLL